MTPSFEQLRQQVKNIFKSCNEGSDERLVNVVQHGDNELLSVMEVSWPVDIISKSDQITQSRLGSLSRGFQVVQYLQEKGVFSRSHAIEDLPCCCLAWEV